MKILILFAIKRLHRIITNAQNIPFETDTNKKCKRKAFKNNNKISAKKERCWSRNIEILRLKQRIVEPLSDSTK